MPERAKVAANDLSIERRSINLREVILRHGGEAQKSRDAFANLV